MAKNQATKIDDWEKYGKIDDFSILEQDLSVRDVVDWETLKSMD